MTEEIIKDSPNKTLKKKPKKKRIIVFSSIIVLVIIIAYFAFRDKDNNEYTFALVEKTNLIQTVSETGTIKSVNEIELNFLNTGKVDEILISIGDKVSSSQILARLDYSDLSIETRQKQAQYEIAQANLDKLLAGATNYEIAVYEANVNQAKTNYESTVKELEKTTATVAEEISQAEENVETGINNEKMNSIIIVKSNLAKAETALDKISTILDDEEIENLLGVLNRTYLFQTQSNYTSSLLLVENTQTEIDIA